MRSILGDVTTGLCFSMLAEFVIANLITIEMELNLCSSV